MPYLNFAPPQDEYPEESIKKLGNGSKYVMLMCTPGDSENIFEDPSLALEAISSDPSLNSEFVFARCNLFENGVVMAWANDNAQGNELHGNPTTFFINPEGKVVSQIDGNHPDKWQQKIMELTPQDY